MKAPDEVEGPVAAVHSWWQAWNDKDRDTIAGMAMEDFIEFPGEGDKRVEGRDAILGTSDGSFARVTIAEWSLSDMEAWRSGDMAVCSYYWQEYGKKDDGPFGQEGWAMDMLVAVDGQWRLQAHHVSKVKKLS
jgi:uncharacterized protein (TIGR02246 family)